MYLHCKNIFIEGQTFAEETGDNRQQSPRDNVWSSSYSEKAGEGGGVEGLEFEFITKDQKVNGCNSRVSIMFMLCNV